MSTLGKVCLVLTLILLLLAMAPIPGKFGGWAPKLLVINNQWAAKLRDSKEKARDAAKSNREARQEFNKAMADVSGLTIGWDKFWNVPVRSPDSTPETPTVAKRGNVLILNNIGSENGLQDLQYVDAAGDIKMTKPTVHAFYGGAEGFTYAGEFTAEQISLKQSELVPVRKPDAQAVANWNPNAAWRLRTMVPPALRTTIDETFQQKQRTKELMLQMDANIVRLTDLSQQAQMALERREGELLGGLKMDPVPSRPEFTDGLLKVTEDVEEERNQLLLEVDQLRRAIKKAYQLRDSNISEMNEKASQLPGAGVQYAEAPIAGAAE